MTETPTEVSRPELELLLAAAVRASQRAAQPAPVGGRRVELALATWLAPAAAMVGAYDLLLLARGVG